jgi:hypothetical protein
MFQVNSQKKSFFYRRGNRPTNYARIGLDPNVRVSTAVIHGCASQITFTSGKPEVLFAQGIGGGQSSHGATRRGRSARARSPAKPGFWREAFFVHRAKKGNAPKFLKNVSSTEYQGPANEREFPRIILIN